MIALDTNILLRYLVQDGGDQAAAATTLMEDGLSADFGTPSATRSLLSTKGF